MKVLCVADLHGREAWYEWLLRKAGDYDAIAVAGDLVDMFRATHPQIEYLREQWFSAFLETGVALAVCTGNHDVSLAGWLSSLRSEHRIVGDGQTEVITSHDAALVVTTIPYRWSFDGAGNQRLTDLWQRGSQLRRTSGLKWLVLHHEPPAPLAPAPVANQLEAWIRLYSPDYVSSGHFHAGPAILGRHAQRIGGTLCYNAGQSENRETLSPYYLVLDAEEGTARRVSGDSRANS